MARTTRQVPLVRLKEVSISLYLIWIFLDFVGLHSCFKYFLLNFYSRQCYKISCNDSLLVSVPLESTLLIWWRHHCQWRAEKCMPLLGANGRWPGRDVNRVRFVVTQVLSILLFHQTNCSIYICTWSTHCTTTRVY